MAKMDPKIMDVLAIVSPALYSYFNNPPLLRKASIERYLSQDDIASAVTVFKMDFPMLLDAFYNRTDTLIRDVFEDDEIDRIAAIARTKEYQEARSLEDSLGKALGEVMKTRIEPVRSLNAKDIEALKEYLLTDGAKLKRSGIRVGDVVLLGRHEEINGDRNWRHDMDAFVGKEARIIKVCSFDLQECELAKVDVDGGDFYWRTCNMRKVK